MNYKGKFPLALSAIFLSAASLQAQHIYNGSGNWGTASNWSQGEVPGTTIDAQAVINGGSTVTMGSLQPNIRALRLEGGSGTATLNINSGASISLRTSSAWDSSIGRSGANGVVNQRGGSIEFNYLELGRDNGTTGEYYLSGGTFNIVRGGNSATAGSSLIIGTNDSGSAGGSATGLMEISGGSLTTRAGVWLGGTAGTANATFRVVGTGASAIGIGTENPGTDGNWTQNTGATLSLRLSPGGVTKILIDDHGNGNNFATFEAGSLLDVDYENLASGGTWTVFELENGDITDNGLTFAPGVDTSIWSFEVDNSGTNGIITVTSSAPVLRDTFWEGSVSTAWENPLNWLNNLSAFDKSYVFIDNGTVNYTDSSVADINLRGFRITDGTLNLSADLDAHDLASATSYMNGTTNHTAGIFDVNVLELGSITGSSALYNLSDGELRVRRVKNGHSLYLGSNNNATDAGNATLTISGGQLRTRSGIKLGDESSSGTGKFTVLGADASTISVGGANTDNDGFWVQNSGSTLEVGIDFTGVTPIVLVDSDSDATGTTATFENGSLLDVNYYNITEGGGTWTVMEVVNGDIIDNGLAFAPGVDTNIWSFAIDNNGANGRLTVSAIGDPLGHSITIGNTQQQQMRYGMDYERLWFWTNGLNSSERDDIARWSAVDTDIDFIRVAMNSDYELNEGTYSLSAYTNKIIPMMEEMQQANPNIKFFASPRPLDEAIGGAAWQPYPRWVTGDPGNGAFDFDPIKCAQYMIRYLRLMKYYGFKISYIDLTNEWQANDDSANRPIASRITQGDARDLVEYMKDYIENPPAAGSDPTDPTGFYADNYPALEEGDMPLTIAPSSWNFSQGGTWISNLDSRRRRDAVDIAASHNTDRTGSAENFVSQVRETLGEDTEIWNTEVHGWKSTSNTNETTSFGYYLEAVRAGFCGLTGWLAIGTTNQGHAYILNPSGTPNPNVKYHIFQKFSSTSNYGYALNIIEEPAAALLADTSDDYDSARNVAAFIKGNLMTVWVINEHSTPLPIVITPSGNTIGSPDVRVTRWTDPSDVEGFSSLIQATSNTSFATTLQGESVYCFEVTLGTETFANQRIEAENFSHQRDTTIETGNDGEPNGSNAARINNGNWLRYGSVALLENSTLRFRLAQANGRPSGSVQIREGDSEGPILGSIAVPNTGSWQTYQTVETTLNNSAGTYNLYMEFVSDNGETGDFANFNWFSVNESVEIDPVTGLTATAVSDSQINLSWDSNANASSYTVQRSSVSGGPYTEIASGLNTTTYSDEALTSETNYYYVVNAVASGEESLPSAEAEAQTLTSAPDITPEHLVISGTNTGYNNDGAPTITFTFKESELGLSYQLYSSDTLNADSWTPVGSVYEGTDGPLEIEALFNHEDPANLKKFFRFVITSGTE